MPLLSIQKNSDNGHKALKIKQNKTYNNTEECRDLGAQLTEITTKTNITTRNKLLINN